MFLHCVVLLYEDEKEIKFWGRHIFTENRLCFGDIWFQNMKTAKLFLIQEMQRSVNGIGSEVSLPRKYFTASQVNSKITICKMKRRNIDDKKCHICVETMSDRQLVPY